MLKGLANVTAAPVDDAETEPQFMIIPFGSTVEPDAAALVGVPTIKLLASEIYVCDESNTGVEKFKLLEEFTYILGKEKFL